MAVMKQIDVCLSRFFEKEQPLKKKWFATLHPHNPAPHLYLFHYHHLVLVYDIQKNVILHEWWEREADKRGLDSAKEWLVFNREKTINFLR